MDCESWQEKAGALIDAELGDAELGPLCHHLGECADCRQFLAGALRMRQTMHRDREGILRVAEEDLSRAAVQPPRPRRAAPGHWLQALAGRWSVPAPAAIGLAAALLVGGAWLGTRVGRAREEAGAQARVAGATPPAVVVVCGLPEVEVRAAVPQR